MSIKKIVDRSDIPEIILADQTIVFTNGCFDILHAGHVQYLEQAKELGDILVVGLNSDASIARLKGKSRPINCEADRALVLAGLEAVDCVIIFEDDTPYDLIKALQPDILVKGGDWLESEIIGAEIVKARGGRVISLPYLAGRSTTDLIKAIQGTK
jgi:rfaE bifunctional protein nucleotidyltransferase chain/domain